MCGIAGLILVPPGPVKSDWVRSLSQNLEHRGPDDSGLLALRRGKVCLERGTNGDRIAADPMADVVLVHRRLSILDLSEAGWQPMGTPDGRYYVVFNGEIYNYLELQAELTALGYRFRSRSDTEVLLAAYAEWGSQALNRLVGMFAFAILDVQMRRLFLARDFFGIKPLYYAYWRDGFIFASEIAPMLELPGIHRRVNPQRLYDYLRFGITDHGGETLLADIKQVPAAHYLEVAVDNPHAAQPVRYWQVDLNQRAELSFDDAAGRLRDLFLESVRLHLRSDVPIGTALSGGIDSSAIVAAMRYLDPTLSIHTFSYVADDPAVSEERWVDLVGATANTVVHKVKASPRELLTDLDELVRAQGECFVSTSMYAQRRVFQRAGETGIKVMLDGQGADELLGGYHYFIAARLGSLLRQGRLDEAVQFLWNASRLPGVGAWWLWLRAIDFLLPSNLQVPLRRWLKKDLTPSWLNSRWFKSNGVEARSPSYTPARDVLRQSLYHTLTETSLPGLLRYEDRNSMAFSIESRVPFLTPSLVNFVLALPEQYIVAPDGTTKAVFRQAMRGIVPDAILDRRDKIGFATPEKAWLSMLRPWVGHVLASETAMQIPAVDARKIQREWDGIVRGHRPFDFRAWRWVNMIVWVEKYAVRIE